MAGKEGKVMKRLKGIVIGRSRFGESSDVIKFLSDELGLVSFAAPGRRRPASKTRAALEILSYSEVVLYERRGDVWLVKEAVLIRGFREITRNLSMFELSGRLLGLLESALLPFGPVDGLVPLVLDFLSVAERTENPKGLYCFALVRVNELFGMKPSLSFCACGAGKVIGFSLESGAICENCEIGIKSVKLSPSEARTLYELEKARWDTINEIAINDKLLALLEAYTRKHLLGV